jgi:hypothetical protein
VQASGGMGVLVGVLVGVEVGVAVGVAVGVEVGVGVGQSLPVFMTRPMTWATMVPLFAPRQLSSSCNVPHEPGVIA